MGSRAEIRFTETNGIRCWRCCPLPLKPSGRCECPCHVIKVGEERLGVQCIDGGKCHHACKRECFRRKCCGPLSGYEGRGSTQTPVRRKSSTARSF